MAELVLAIHEDMRIDGATRVLRGRQVLFRRFSLGGEAMPNASLSRRCVDSRDKPAHAVKGSSSNLIADQIALDPGTRLI
jgi:hypothetical protein